MEDARTSAAAQAGAGQRVAPEAAAEIQRHLANHDTKSALKAAKILHRELNSPDSEALLVDVYLARIAALRKRGLTIEADALEQSVLADHPLARARANVPTAQVIQRASLGQLLGCLNEPTLTAADREAIDRRIRSEVTDLSVVAESQLLAADHPLRVAAAAIIKAFEAATSGPVDDSGIALAEVSHRSPLADWKTVVRAIACLHRGEDATCRRLIDGMGKESAACRLVPALRAMLDGAVGLRAAGLGGPSKALFNAVQQPDDAALRSAVGKLDAVLTRDGDSRRLPVAARRAVALCRSSHPELLDRLRQHISIRGLLLGCSVPEMVSAMGGPSLHDSHFWRLLARVRELQRDPAEACATWAEFRRHAIHEGLLTAGGPEEAALYLHMADLLVNMPTMELFGAQDFYQDDFSGYPHYYDQGQPARVRALAPKAGEEPDTCFIYPEELFERICRIEADSGVYARWLAFAKRCHAQTKDIEDVALRWHKARPADKAPLLHLFESAERRNALDKALKFLRKAEELDALDPAIRRARVRLAVAKTLRHIRQGRGDLASRDLDELAQWPQASEGDRPAFLAALGWLVTDTSAQAEAAGDIQQQIGRLLGDELTGRLLLAALAELVGGSLPLPGVFAEKLPPGDIVQSASRVFALAEDIAVGIGIPRSYQNPLREGLLAGGCSADPVGLMALARACLGVGDLETAYLAAGAGLRQGGRHDARFLLLRGQSLPGTMARRRAGCFRAAAELARRRRDLNLAAEAADIRRRDRGFGREHVAADAMTGEELSAVLGREKDAVAFHAGEQGNLALRPAAAWHDGPDEKEADGADDERLESIFEDEDESEGNMPPTPLEGVPPQLLKALVEMFVADGGRPPSAKSIENFARMSPEMAAELARMLDNFDPSDEDGPFPGHRLDDLFPGRRRNAGRRRRAGSRG